MATLLRKVTSKHIEATIKAAGLPCRIVILNEQGQLDLLRRPKHQDVLAGAPVTIAQYEAAGFVKVKDGDPKNTAQRGLRFAEMIASK